NARKGFYLLRIDPRSHRIICDSKKYFADCSCNIVFADKQQRLWIGTNNGLFMQDLQRKIIDASPIAAGNMIDSSININSLFITGNAILAGAWGRGMLVIGKQGGHTSHAAKACLRAHGLSHIYAGLQQSPDTLWLSTDSGLVWLHTRNYSCGRVNTQGIEELSGQPHIIYHLFKDRGGNTWISSDQLNRIYCYSRSTGRFETIGGRVQDSLLRVNAVEGFTEDNRGNIWISGDAVARWNPRKRAIDTLIERLPSQRNRKKGFKVVSDARGDTWILITGDGIVKMTGPDAPMHLREKDLSWDYDIFRYPSVHQDAVFVSSDNNIGILNTRTYKGVTLGTADGLPDRIISTWFFGYDASDSSTWFACGNQLCRIPGNVFVNNQPPPVFTISELNINSDSVIAYPGTYVALNHEQNNLRVSFSAINFTDVPNMRYYYRLLNTDDTAWAITTSQQVQFNHLNPGVYRLQLQVAALNSQWPAQVKEMTIRIRPPYWKTAWFISVAGLLVLLIAYDIYKRKIKSIRKTERGKARVQQLEAELAEAQLSALQTQMNPHFIFNALNSIKRMMLDSDTRKASRYLSKFALMIRLTLDHSKATFVTLRESIEYLEAYLEMEQLRFDDSFSYIIQIDGNMDDEEAAIPSLMMQPLAENAIWHGLMTKEGKKMLRIGFAQQDHRIACTIEDNGIGIRQSERLKEQYKAMHRSVGIGNLRHRIRIMNEKFATACTLDITDLQDIDPAKSGTLAVLTFNKINR
ncbi:MAG TPA: histidine kinase, partial [Chitinophagaceae bacterium]|nr:histidine kinase [Chitinophagaceae bacterium]